MTIQGLTPTLSAPVTGQTASGSSSTSTSSSSNSSTSLQTEFLNLLVTELQNQDPTSPVDPTAMVGQMVSLNELDQLISINQVLQQSFGSGTSRTPPATGARGATGNASHQVALGASSGLVPASSMAPQTTTISQPESTAYPGSASLMNLYGSLTSAAPGSTSITSGGK